MSIVLALVVALPLAWGVFAPLQPADATNAFGAALALVALVVLALVHARQLVHAPALVLVLIAAAGGAVTWACVELATLPVVANGGRLLLAAALGALLARFVERASWIVVLAVLAGAVDVWSVYADEGITNRVLDAAGRGADGGLLELLLFTGPVVGGTPLLAIGVTDLVFLALFLAWSHDWRLDLRIAAGALLAAAWIGLVASELAGDAFPLLPFLAAAMVLVVFGRSLMLRSRVSAWRPAPATP
jgi:hypothetical protein